MADKVEEIVDRAVVLATLKEGHKGRIELSPVRTTCVRGACSCGWVGSARWQRQLARADVFHHLGGLE